MQSKRTDVWPDEQLLELLQAGDNTAFELIYNKYWSKLYLAAYNVLRDRQGAEDVVQEVLVSLWFKREGAAIDSLQAYLYTAVRYQVFKAVRSGKARQQLPEAAGSIVVANEAEAALCEHDLYSLLEQGITRLPDKCRQVFLLSRREHLSTTEIAQQLGITSKTAENHLTIALRRLRTTLGSLLVWGAVLFVAADKMPPSASPLPQHASKEI
ncbi:RNA polymerase sigma factor [Pontibacter liquoris]|uniref:RNA polymerase sigma factor n=1 Tax=Pontibacter liquoris TaxID=2905677 RepID=UPI001FA757F2|nr:RNA polymerase sigma-70 factor [Pontibacter liquoris]